MGCLSSKEQLGKERGDEFGFDQTYRQKELQMRGHPAGRHPVSTLPRKDGTLDRRSRSNSSQFDPHKDMIIQTLKSEGQYRVSGGDMSAYRGGPIDTQYRGGPADGQRTVDRRNGTVERRAKEQRRDSSAKDSERRVSGSHDRRGGDANGRGGESEKRDSYYSGGGGGGTAERRNRRSAAEATMTSTPKRGEQQDNFSRNQFDRASQLRRSKKKRKKSSAADQSMSPGARSARSEMSGGETPCKSDKTAESIVSDYSQRETKDSNSKWPPAKTEYDPKYGNLI